MKHRYAKITCLILISFLALFGSGCGESGNPGGDTGPGATASIVLNAGLDSMPADGVTSTTINATLRDSSNEPVFERTAVVFRTNRGTFRNGSQEYKVKIPDDSGSVSVTLIADSAPGTAEIWAESNSISQKIDVRFFDPGKIGSISLRTGAASITADGKSQVAVIATVEDNLGDPEEGATVTFKTTLGEFVEDNSLPGIINRTTEGDTDVDGEASVMLVSGTTIGTATILASINGRNATATVTFTADEPQTITLRAAPSVVKPNGTSTLFARLTDANGNPVANQNVVFSQATNASEGTLNILTASTDVNGEAQAAYTAGDDEGTDILQAALESNLGMKAQTSVTVDPGAIVIAGIDVTAGAPSLVADGKSQVNIRAIVTDIDGNRARGKIVTFTTTAGTLSSATGTTDENGIAEVLLQSTTIAGPVTVRADCDGFIGETAVEFVPGPAHHIIMYAFPDTVPPNGPFETAAIVQDEYDNRIDDQRLMLQVRRAGDPEIVDTAEMTPDQAEDGVFRFDWTAAGAYGEGNLEVTALVNNGVSETVTVVVDETATIVGAINVIAGAEEIKADGKSSVLIRATVLDYDGNPARGITVEFDTTLGTLSSAEKETDANGIADVMLTAGETWGTAMVTADANGFWGEVDVRFTSLKAGGVSLTTMPREVAAGGTATVIAELRDDKGAPVPDQVLYFDIYENSTNATLSDIQGTTDTNGRVTITYIAGVNLDDLCTVCDCSGDRIRVTLASDSSITDETCVVVATSPLGSITLSSGLDTLPADGASRTGVRAIVQNMGGEPVVGVPVFFTTTAGTIETAGGDEIESTESVTTDINGMAEVYLRTSTTAGTAQITATAEGLGATLNITFVAGPPADEKVIVTPVPKNLTADGISTSTINLEVRDLDDNPISGANLVLTVDYGTLNQLSVVTVNGKATVTYTAPSSPPDGGIATVTAKTTNGTTADASISLTGILVAGITLTADPPSLPANGTSQSMIRAQVTAVGGGNVPDGTEVTFEIVSGEGSISPETSTTAAGEAFTFLTSDDEEGTVTIRATAGGRIAEIDVVYTAGSVSLTIIPNALLGTGVAESKIVATVLNADDDPIADGQLVELDLSDLTMGEITTTNPAPTTGGKVEFTFRGKQKGGAVTVTAITQGAPAPGLSASGIIDIQPPPAFMQVADGYPDPTSISIRGTGGQSTSIIVFDVKDLSGNLVADGYRVDFSLLDGPNGGEALDPLTAMTKDGKVSTILRSGFKSGPVTIKATYYYNTSVFTTTASIAISSGPPVGEEFGIFAEFLNVSGLWKANLQDSVYTNVGDIYGNAVPDGTAIAFKTYNTGGSFFPNSDNTISGLAESVLRTPGTYTTAQGFMIATAEANNAGRTTHVRSIGITPTPYNNIMYAGTDGGGVYKSTNSGASWSNVSRSSEQGKEGQNYIDPYVNDICVKSGTGNHNTVYAATGYLGRGNIFRSIDGGITWQSGHLEEWNGLFAIPSAVLTLSCDDAGSDYVWAGTDGYGAVFAEDGENFRWGGEVTNKQLDPGPAAGDQDITGITEDDPELSATSKTETWTATYTQTGAVTRDLIFSCGTAGCPADGADSMTGLAATVAADAETWRVTYEGGWYDYDETSANSSLDLLAVSASTANENWTVTCTNATAGSEEFTVYGSISGFNANYTDWPTNYVSDNGEIIFYIDPGFALNDVWTFKTRVDGWEVERDDGGGFVSQAPNARTGQTYTSNDGAVTFTINAPATATRFYREDDSFEFETVPIGEWVVEGDVSGLQARRAQTAIPYESDNEQVSFIIREDAGNPYDIGDEWSFDVTESGLGYGKIVRDIVRAAGTEDNATLYAATASGVYRSTNGGLTWAATQGFTGDNITCLAVNPDYSNVIYAGTEDAGVWYTLNGNEASAGNVSWESYNDGLGGGLSATTPVPGVGNAGTGVMGAVSVGPETQTETWTVICVDTTTVGSEVWDVTGSVSGPQAQATTGVAYSIADTLGFLITAGGAPFALDDTFTFRTTRDPGSKIKDILLDPENRQLYASTYFFGEFEPHAVGNVYSSSVRGAAATNPGRPFGSWNLANTGLPQYDPPDDTTLFPQHALAFDADAGTDGALYVGGEGINFYKASTGIDTGEPAWQISKTGLTNRIMARMPILFTDVCSMNIASEEVNDGIHTYTVYVQDFNGNPPIVGSTFTVSLERGNETTVLLNVEYPDTYTYAGTWRDPTDIRTNNPFIIRTQILPFDKVIFNFTPTCLDEAPGCSGSEQEVTLTY